ncbi:MAG TPA: hypothetical protein VGG63_18340 [Steroidobacteraceae bacterium]
MSTLLTILGCLLLATTRKWPIFTWDKRTLSQIYQDARGGNLRSSSLYAKIVTPASILLIIIGIYLGLTWR